MSGKTLTNLVITQCKPEDDERFNNWYSNIHIPALMKFKGMRAATRYRQISSPKEGPIYLTIYEFDSEAAFKAYNLSPEFVAAEKEREESWGPDGFKLLSRVQYEPIKSWKK